MSDRTRSWLARPPFFIALGALFIFISLMLLEKCRADFRADGAATIARKRVECTERYAGTRTEPERRAAIERCVRGWLNSQ